MENKLIFDMETATIRQMPQNYMVAYMRGGRWVCDTPDAAADPALVGRVLLALQNPDNVWDTGTSLIKTINAGSSKKFEGDIIKIASVSKNQYLTEYKWVKENLFSTYQNHDGWLESIYEIGLYVQGKEQNIPEFMREFQLLLASNGCSYFRFD